MATSTDNTNGRLKITAYNNVETTQFEYQITFDKFSTRTDEQQYNTDVFTPPGKYEPKLFIALCTIENTTNLEETTFDTKLSLHLEDSKAPVNVRSKIWILKEGGEKLLLQENTFCLTKEGNKPEHCIYSTPKTAIQDQSQNLLFEDKLTYICEFSMDVEYNTETEKISNEPTEKLDESRPLVKDFETLFQTKMFSDIDLKVGGLAQTFKVHKGILAARSPFFHELFYGNRELKEIQTNDIQISEEIFEVLLKYIYTNKIPEMDKNVSQLLAGAHQLGLKSLKSICELAMSAQLSPETMFETFKDAEKYSALELKAKTIDYIDKHARVTDVLAALYTKK